MVPTQEEQIFPLSLHWTELWFFDFCRDNGSPDGRDVQDGLTDQMVYQRHVGRFLVFSVYGVWFNLQDLYFIATYFVWPSLYTCWANFDFSSRPCVSNVSAYDSPF
jgi:hypothetical protein